MSDFDRLIKGLARAGELASRARQGDEKVIDELIDSLRAYTSESANTYESGASYESETSYSKESEQSGEAQRPARGVDKTIADYHATKDAMAEIIDKHMQAAFDEIYAKYGTTPTDVTLRIDPRQPADGKYPRGRYTNSRVQLGGE